jgi:GTP-binding protein LepA
LIEATGTIKKREMKEQVLDTLDLERERGITIKLNAVRMTYAAKSGESYEFNLIDTPGHVDFTYEVSRSLAACEGAILVVDASQGIQAQTLSNLFLALDAGLEIVPVLNKIDLPGAEPERRKQEMHDLIGADPDDILLVSAKEGIGIDALLEAIVRRVPAPAGDPDAPVRALIFDSYYDRYRGAIPSVRVVDGTIAPGMKIRFAAGSGDSYEVAEVGYYQLRQVESESLGPGEVGYVVANVRTVKETRARFPATKMCIRWCSPDSTQRIPVSTRRSATHSRSSSSTTPHCTTSPRPPRRSASASARDSSGCSTWRSCKNGSSVSSI